MAGGWVVVFVLLAVSESSLGAAHDAVQGLPLILELLVWLIFFPFVLALNIWASSWDEGLRLVLVYCCAVAWTIAFFPRRTAEHKSPRSR